MGKSKSKGMDVNVTAYKWKQLMYRLGGELPPDLKLKMADELTEIQRLNYQMAYGVFNRVWREIVRSDAYREEHTERPVGPI